MYLEWTKQILENIYSMITLCFQFFPAKQYFYSKYSYKNIEKLYKYTFIHMQSHRERPYLNHMHQNMITVVTSGDGRKT